MGLSVEVKEGKTILQAAVDNHIDLPHACGGMSSLILRSLKSYTN
jgi:ferredoxin